MRATIYAEPFAGLLSQALGLAEAAGLAPDVVDLVARFPFSALPAALWPSPLAAVGLKPPHLDPGDTGLALTVGGVGGAVGAALRRRGTQIVQIQNPRMALGRFDLVIANAHDEIGGPNVITVRTALHRASQARLREAREIWLPRFAHLPRPLVAVLVGGSNGRYRLGAGEGEALAGDLSGIMRRDKAGLLVSPSRRTAPVVREALVRRLAPMGAWIWDMAGENPYFGMLACADMIVVTIDSVSMISEAVATHAPVLLAELPGRSRRGELFLRAMKEAGRVRPFAGRLGVLAGVAAG